MKFVLIIGRSSSSVSRDIWTIRRARLHLLHLHPLRRRPCSTWALRPKSATSTSTLNWALSTTGTNSSRARLTRRGANRERIFLTHWQKRMQPIRWHLRSTDHPRKVIYHLIFQTIFFFFFSFYENITLKNQHFDLNKPKFWLILNKINL